MVAKLLLAVFPVAAWLLCLSVDAAHAIGTDSLPFLAGQDRDAVVIVRNKSGSSEGTGVVIGYDHARQTAYVLTANHVIEQGDGSVVLRGDRERPARNIRRSLAKDLCVLSVRPAPALPFLDIDPNFPLAAGESHLVIVGRDSTALKQHPGTFVEEFDFSQGVVAARCLELEAVALPGFSGGPLLALTGGRPVVVGLLTHGTVNRASGPTAEEILTFLAEAGVPLGASGATESVAANSSILPEVEPECWTDERLAGDFIRDAVGETIGDDGLKIPDESQADFDRMMAGFESRLDAIAREVDAESFVHDRPSAPARRPSPAARRGGGRQTADPDVQVIEIPGYGVRIVIRSR